jgi:diguanylate cyclase (GGDEF)-like protein
MEGYAETFVPVIRDRNVIAVLDVYQDQTGDKYFYEKYFFLIGGPLALAVLIGGWFFLFRIYFKMVDYRIGEIRALSLANHDSLTDIPNRARLRDFAERALAGTRRAKQQVAVLLIDLDRFKEINDTFGHTIGDEVLRVVATRMRSAVREEDMVARLGGDEFVVLQLGMAQPTSAASLAKRLLKSISEPYNIGDIEIAGGGSIGAAIAPIDAERWEELLRCADAALYNAKAGGGNIVCFFQPGMDAIFQQREQIEVDLS